jgi:glycosyltransferase involved in cell wall biosynthesis
MFTFRLGFKTKLLYRQFLKASKGGPFLIQLTHLFLIRIFRVRFQPLSRTKTTCFCQFPNLALKIKAPILSIQLQLLLKEKGYVFAVAGAPSSYAFSSGNVVNLGFVSSPQIMASLYRNAKCTLVISQEESFSMPVAESLCCGTPVAGFKAGGPESFADSRFSAFADQGDVNSLILNLIRLSATRVSEDQSKHFAPSSIAQQYLKLFQK